MPELLNIFVYPIKSTKACKRTSAIVEKNGLQGDRRWMIVDAKWSALTQREVPKLGQIIANVLSNGLEINLPGLSNERVAIEECTEIEHEVSIWDDVVSAVTAPAFVNQKLTQYLEKECSLVYMKNEDARPIESNFNLGSETVSFADGFPVLLASQASLDTLNEKLPKSVSHLRFRPNLVVAGVPPFEEDNYKFVEIGQVRFRIVKPCARCVMIELDPDTGQRTPGVNMLRTLAEYRKIDNKVMWGQNLVPESIGEIQIGDHVKFFN